MKTNTTIEAPRFLKPSNGAVSDEQLSPLTETDTATRAYFLWEKRGRPVGSPETDWFHAQEEESAWTKHSELELTT